MSTAKHTTPRYIAGTVSPIGTDRHPMPQPEPLLPDDIRQVARSIEISDYTPEGVNEAIERRYWPCVEELIVEGAQRIPRVNATQGGATAQEGIRNEEDSAMRTGIVHSNTLNLRYFTPRFGSR